MARLWGILHDYKFCCVYMSWSTLLCFAITKTNQRESSAEGDEESFDSFLWKKHCKEFARYSQ